MDRQFHAHAAGRTHRRALSPCRPSLLAPTRPVPTSGQGPIPHEEADTATGSTCSTMAAAGDTPAELLNDIFTVTAVNPDGKKFDKGWSSRERQAQFPQRHFSPAPRLPQ